MIRVTLGSATVEVEPLVTARRGMDGRTQAEYQPYDLAAAVVATVAAMDFDLDRFIDIMRYDTKGGGSGDVRPD